MNPREKKLLIGIAVVAGIGFAAKVAVPKWLGPMFDYDKEIAKLEGRRADYEPPLARLDVAVRRYQEYTNRTGGTDANWVSDQFTRTMNELLGQCRLTDVRVTPKEAAPDRKTGLVTLGYSISAQGGLQDAVTFMKLFYEIPYIARFRDMKISPIKGRKGAPSDAVQITGGIDVLVPPKPDGPIPVGPVLPPVSVPKHRGEGYALIWEKDPVNPPAKPEPAPVITPPVVATIDPPPEPPQPRGPERDHDGAQKIIRMCMAGAAEEVLVVHAASKQREFVAKGHDLDGGKILMVHPLGALVRRSEGGQDYDFLYPIGEALADSVRIDQAQRFPELRAFARHYLAEERAKTKTVRDAAAREQAAREVTEREVTDQYGNDVLIGPPVELAAPDPNSILSPMDPLHDAFIYGPPAELTGRASPEQRMPHIDDMTATPSSEIVGPPAELAEPSPEPKKDRATRRPAPRINRVRKPAAPD